MKLVSRKTVLVLLDMTLIWVSVFLSYFLKFDGHIPIDYLYQCFKYAALSMLIGSASLIYFKLYRRIWQYASIGEMVSIIKAVTVTCTISYILMLLVYEPRIPFSIYFRVLENMFIIIGASRFVWRIFRDNYHRKKNDQLQTLIIGAGDCGHLIAKELKFNPTSPIYPVGFIDDHPAKLNHQIMGTSCIR
ncbi:nucleoside-diphosphate sugar epimerase/dehydratase [Paenibacillus hexagrammi]|uniref:nucleoside-diphosphate sugar epimerase/dehydratase n=1 Tax=Paenibacillus hexagrammi TaxID=2908839 RepID=UPI002882F12F|nr:hypothetical protein [Paenibacillus sp. YPD9-1]